MDLKKLTNHNRYQIVTFGIAALFLLFVYSCESQTTHPTDPSRKVTRAQLRADVENYLTLVAIAEEDLTKQDEIRQIILDQVNLIGQGGTLNFGGILLGLSGILGSGAIVDGVRRRKKPAE